MRSPCPSLCEYSSHPSEHILPTTILTSPRAMFPAIDSVSDAAASVFNVMNDYLAQRAFSRKLEEEADALGLEVGLQIFPSGHALLTFVHRSLHFDWL